MTATRTCLACRYPLQAFLDHRCPECGREFDPDDGRTFGVSFTTPVRLVVYRAEALAHAARTELAQSDILTSLESRSVGISGFNDRQEHAIWVDAADFEAAETILAAARAGSGGVPWRCPSCREDVPDDFEICWKCGTARH